MPINTYELLAENVVTNPAGVASVEFTSLPTSPYSDLILAIQTGASSGTASTEILVRINGATTNYNGLNIRYTQGGGSATTVAGDNAIKYLGLTAYVNDTNLAWPVFIQFFDYNSTNRRKTMLGKWGNLPNNGGSFTAHKRHSTSVAITSISVSLAATNLNEDSKFYLYGLKA